ncbi:MAG: hypothetical protein JJE09_15485 [Bacteroidia bacterium]|nr:hypothetical protein [Bacteroidia bacterium]
MQLQQIKSLINLARVDGEIVERERSYILNIGHANKIKPGEILPLFVSSHEEIVPAGLTNDQKFKYIFNLVQLMKIDEKMYRKEIKYCSHVAAKLGYNEQVMLDLMLHVSSTMGEAEVKALEELIRKYLTK